ncbi:MAG: lipid-A-disaccharide synthase [Archangiaceae bacterium]|nr:lipid-A-disaccharide synthase [Archangiaceae bacterium]
MTTRAAALYTIARVKPPSVLVVAGEASGDGHGADVVRAMKAKRPELTFFGMGGPKLEAAGLEVIHGAHEISVMGIAEVLPKIPRILKVLGDLERTAKERRPAVALLIDVPDFNLRLAERLKALGIPIVYFVAPMIWAWREGRAKRIGKLVDELCCILPFEEPFLRERGVNATYVGSPVLDQVPPLNEPAHFRRALGLDVSRPVLAVLPGSRRSEIGRLGALMRDVAKAQREAHPGLQVVVPVAPGLPTEFVRAAFEGVEVTLIAGRAPEVVGAADVGLVASGTATLEAGLMRRPFVTIYRVSPLTYAVGKALVRIPFFCLVNLLAKKRVVPELLQGDVTVPKVMAELEALWSGPAREACLTGLDEVRASLGATGAAARVAERVLARLVEVPAKEVAGP